MFGIGTSELIVILVVALVLLGPKRLPEAARMLGRGLALLRKEMESVKESLEVAGGLDEADEDTEPGPPAGNKKTDGK